MPAIKLGIWYEVAAELTQMWRYWMDGVWMKFRKPAQISMVPERSRIMREERVYVALELSD